MQEGRKKEGCVDEGRKGTKGKEGKKWKAGRQT
jgi:hypothetical protein